jgi:hypothetical protein
MERVALAAAVPTGDLLDAAAALVQSIAGQGHDVERVHHATASAGEPVHRNHLDAVAPGRVSPTESTDFEGVSARTR